MPIKVHEHLYLQHRVGLCLSEVIKLDQLHLPLFWGMVFSQSGFVLAVFGYFTGRDSLFFLFILA